MPRAFTEGFDYYPSTGTGGIGLASTWIMSGDFFGSSLVVGRFAGQAYNFGNGAGGKDMTRLVPATRDIVFGMAFWRESFSREGPVKILSFRGPTGVEEFALLANEVGQLSLLGGVANSGVNRIDPGVWHYIEVAIHVDPLAGTCKVRLDGELIIDYAGNTGDTDIERIAVVGIPVDRVRIDDIVCDYNSTEFIGEGRILQLPITANDAVQWTPSAGANWENIDESQADTTTFNTSTTPGHRDIFLHGALGFVPERIYGVQVVTCSRKDEAGTRVTKNILKSGASEVLGEANYQTESWRYYRDFFATDPATSAEWTVAGVNATKVGYELTT